SPLDERGFVQARRVTQDYVGHDAGHRRALIGATILDRPLGASAPFCLFVEDGLHLVPRQEPETIGFGVQELRPRHAASTLDAPLERRRAFGVGARPGVTRAIGASGAGGLLEPQRLGATSRVDDAHAVDVGRAWLLMKDSNDFLERYREYRRLDAQVTHRHVAVEGRQAEVS